MSKQFFLENTPQQSKGCDGKALLIWDRHGFLSKNWKSNEGFLSAAKWALFLYECAFPFHFGVLLQGLLSLSLSSSLKDMWDLIDTLIFIPCPQERLWFSLIPGTGLLSSRCNRQGQEAGQLLPSLSHTLLALSSAHWLETISHLSPLLSLVHWCRWKFL